MNKDYKIGSVIVAVDFSKHAAAACREGRALAKKWKVPLTFVHGFDDPAVSEERFDTIISSMTQFYEKRIKTVYKTKAQEKVFVRCGRPYEVILDAGKQEQNPLIIVGHQGATNRLEKMFLGSTAERVAQKSPFPVWIHRGALAAKMGRALIPCDLSDRGADTAKFLQRNAIGKVKTELFNVTMYPAPLFDLQSWRELSEEVRRQSGIRLEKFEKSYPALKVVQVQSQAKEDLSTHICKRARSFDFIAMAPRAAKGFFAGLGSVTSKVARQSSKPILIVPTSCFNT